MDEQEPKEQFEATDYDEEGNIKLPPPPLAAAKQKRPTVAGLKKELDELKDFIGDTTVREISQLKAQTDTLKADIEHDVLDWLGNLDMRLESIEATTATHNKTLIGDVKTRLLVIEEVSSKILPTFIDDMIKKCDNQDAAIDALADALRTYGEGIADWGSRMEECEDSITSLQTANADIQESEKHTELEFVQPPQQTESRQARAGDIGSLRQTYPPVQMAGGQIRKSDIEAVASVCQTMTDVLLICRLLKAEQSIPDEDRTYLLTIACRAAGVPLSGGLQIRAGVRNVVA